MACTPKSARLEAAHSTVIFSFLVKVDSVVPSSARSLRKTGVSSGTGIVPTQSNRSSSAGEAGTLAISRARCSVISAGTLFGAQAPSQASRLGEFLVADDQAEARLRRTSSHRRADVAGTEEGHGTDAHAGRLIRLFRRPQRCPGRRRCTLCPARPGSNRTAGRRCCLAPPAAAPRAA